MESILGAFLAGAIVGLVDRDSSSHPDFRTKLDAIGYGFLMLFLLAPLAVRGLPALAGPRVGSTYPNRT